MEVHIALRVRDREGEVRLYPASKFDYLSHSLRHTVYAVIGGHVFNLADCASEEECFAVEREVFIAICGYPDYVPPRPRIQIYSLNRQALAALKEFRRTKDTAEASA